MACDSCNPCEASESNTVACESLSSQVNNFVTQFFGTVVKTEVDGAITWSLPCSLDVGLENNPRATDEGLACYFLRLFQDGIIGLTGPQGLPGLDGENGNNAYTVTMAGFTQPSLGFPNITISTVYNPAIVEGMYVFIATSGWYLVTATDTTGTLWLTLTRALDTAPFTVNAGKLVIPSGYPGSSVVGPQGPTGATGPQGTPGESFTETNGMYFATVGTDYNLQVAYAAVDFVNSSARVLLPDPGTYTITVSVDIIGLTGVATSDEIYFRLRDNNALVTLDASEHASSRIAEDELRTISFTAHYDNPGTNSTIALQGKCTSADVVAVVALRTTMTYVRLQ